MIYHYDIFISHSNKNKNEVLELSERLKRDGYKVWLDAWEILIGDDFPQKIVTGVKHSKFVAVWLTKDAVNSFWVNEEWTIKLIKSAQSRNPVIFPLKAEECEIPDLLLKRKYANFSKSFEHGYAQLISALEHNSLKAMDECKQKLIEGTEDAEFAAHLLYRMAVFSNNEEALQKLWEASQNTIRPYTILDHIVFYYTQIMLESNNKRIKELGFDILEKSIQEGKEAIVDKYSYAAGDLLLKSKDNEQRLQVANFVKKQLKSETHIVNFWYNQMKKRVDENDQDLLN